MFILGKFPKIYFVTWRNILSQRVLQVFRKKLKINIDYLMYRLFGWHRKKIYILI
jgi:hypothetical protein